MTVPEYTVHIILTIKCYAPLSTTSSRYCHENLDFGDVPPLTEKSSGQRMLEYSRVGVQRLCECNYRTHRSLQNSNNEDPQRDLELFDSFSSPFVSDPRSNALRSLCS
jgi:hypothetical protein